MHVVWRVGQRYRALGPNPANGGKWEAPEIEVIGVDVDRSLYMAKSTNGANLYGGTITFEAAEKMWKLIADAPAEVLL